MYRADQQPSVAEEGQSLAAELRCPASGYHKPYAEEVTGGSWVPQSPERLQFTSGMNAMIEKCSLLFRIGRWGSYADVVFGWPPSFKLSVVQHRHQVERRASFPSRWWQW